MNGFDSHSGRRAAAQDIHYRHCSDWHSTISVHGVQGTQRRTGPCPKDFTILTWTITASFPSPLACCTCNLHSCAAEHPSGRNKLLEGTCVFFSFSSGICLGKQFCYSNSRNSQHLFSTFNFPPCSQLMTLSLFKAQH